MSKDKELEIQLQFLDEAQEYLNTLESAMLGLADSRSIDVHKINAALRAAHSIKGGAGMMGFQTLSGLAHRLEDSLKVLKTQKSIAIDAELEALLLSGLDCLHQVIRLDREACLHGTHPAPIDPYWLETQADPIFEQLWQRLGDPQAEDANSVLSPEDGQDVIPLLFQTEVEGCLQRLEAVLTDPAMPCLREELSILAQELGGLGEMLQLSAFTSLCESITQRIDANTDPIEATAQLALQAWRRTQALILTGNYASLPTAIEGASPTEAVPATWVEHLDAADLPFFDNLENLEVIESLEPLDADFVAEPFFTEEPAVVVDADEFSFSTDEALQEADELVIDEVLQEADGFSFSVNEVLQEAGEFSFSADQALEQSDEFSFNSHAAVEEAEVTSFVSSTEALTSATDPLEAEAFPVTAANAEVWNFDPPTQEIPVRPASREAKVRESKVTDFRVLEVKPEIKSDKGSSTASEGSDTVRVPIKQLNQLNDLFGELTIERNGLDLHLKRLHNLVRTLSQRVQTLDRSNTQLRAAYDRLATQGSIALTPIATEGAWTPPVSEHASSIVPYNSRFDVLEMDRYDNMHLMSQEVMETIVQIREVTSDIELGLEDTDQTFRELNKTAKQLQTSLTQVRMRPLSDVLDRFPRALRELSLQYGKPVELKIHGGSTLIDRNILEALGDPLMHLLRNAFDHGIEDPATRRDRGKSEQGSIEIRAMHRSNRTIITITDDGGGIPLDKIRIRARQMGLDEVLLAAASDEDLLSLIFEPGFSTNDKVTALSGRGVGMDVVRDNLKQVRGEIKVNTQAGRGTTFTLAVPFTLTVVRVLLAESNGMLLAFPTDVVEEMLVIQPDQVMTAAGSEVFAWEDSMVPLVRLHRWLMFHRLNQVEGMEGAPAISEPTVLMVNQGNQRVGIQVDRCWGEQEVATRQVEGNLPMSPGFNNCTILGDGRVVPLVNTAELLHWIMSYERSQQVLAAEAPPAPPVQVPLGLPAATPPRLGQAATTPQLPPQKTTILIVDDSINVRRFLALTLEKAGYRVEQAKDGQEAIEKLIGGLSVNAVICDIEMPRLDGYGFLAQVKSNSNLASIPVAMLTSRSGDKHRKLAMSLGATAYFSKPYNEQTLLRTLTEITGLAPIASTV